MTGKRPRIAFFESVKNLVSHDNSNTFRVICKQLDKLGYKYLFQVMNASEYGDTPRNRERIYLVAFRDKEDYANFKLLNTIPLHKKIKGVIDFYAETDEKYYYIPDRCKFYDTLKKI